MLSRYQKCGEQGNKSTGNNRIGNKCMEHKLRGNKFLVNKRLQHHLQFSFGWPDDDVCNKWKNRFVTALVRM